MGYKIIPRRVVISPYAGGLGDVLCCSTLPEMYARLGHEVFIGRSAMEPRIRNPETCRLVWEANPFVSGFTDELGITFTHQEMHQWIWAQPHTRTLVEAMEVLHGFPPTHVFPKLYYRPRARPDFEQLLVADPTSISQPMLPEVFDAYIDHVCRARGFERSSIVMLASAYAGRNGVGALLGNRRYVVRDVFEYADIIASCRAFFTSESGGAILASALRGTALAPEVFSLFTTHGMNDRLFQFPNVRYCVSGAMTGDYYVHPQ